MSAASIARRVLVEGDHKAFRRLWPDLFPQFATEAPKTDEEAEIALHQARTEAKSIPLKLRLWSHRWLTERGLHSALPERLRPKAEQIAPVIAAGVGIAVHTASPILKPAVGVIRCAMENAVLDAAADGKLEDSDFVKARMQEARNRTVKELFGSVSLPAMKGRSK